MAYCRLHPRWPSSQTFDGTTIPKPCANVGMLTQRSPPFRFASNVAWSGQPAASHSTIVARSHRSDRAPTTTGFGSFPPRCIRLIVFVDSRNSCARSTSAIVIDSGRSASASCLADDCLAVFAGRLLPLFDGLPGRTILIAGLLAISHPTFVACRRICSRAICRGGGGVLEDRIESLQIRFTFAGGLNNASY